MANVLKKNFYLVIAATKTRYGSYHLNNPRVVLGKNGSPKCKAGEVAIKVSLSLPEILFTEPKLQATIEIPESDVSRPEINAEIKQNIAGLVREVHGVEIEVSNPSDEQ